MTTKIGLEVVTYNAGSIGSPVFTDPIGIIKDEQISIEKALTDTTDRRAKGWRVQRGTLKEGSIELQLNYDDQDNDFQAFESAFFADTQLVLFFSDGDATEPGTYKGLLAACNVTTFNVNRQNEEAVSVDVTLTLDLEASTAEAPRWHSVTVPE